MKLRVMNLSKRPLNSVTDFSFTVPATTLSEHSSTPGALRYLWMSWNFPFSAGAHSSDFPFTDTN